MKSVKKSTFIATCVVLGLAVLYLSVLQVILHNETSESFYQPTAMSRSTMTHPSAGAVASSQHSRPGSLGSGSAGSAAGLNVPAVSRSNRSATYAVRLSAPRTGAPSLAFHAGTPGQASLSAGASSSATLYAVSSATRGGAMARVSAGGGVSPASGGLYTTSSGQLHSYGGGGSAGGASRAGGSTSSAAGASASAGAAGGASLSIGGLGGASYTPTYTLALSTNTLSSNTSGSNGSDQASAAAAMAARNGNYGIYSNGYSSLSTYSGSYLSADSYLAYSQMGTPGKRYIAPGGNQAVVNSLLAWLQSIVDADPNNYLYYANGVYYFSEEGLHALFEAASQSGNFPGLDWKQFLAWFTPYSTGEGAKYSFPVGEPWILLVLALGLTLWRSPVLRKARVRIARARVARVRRRPRLLKWRSVAKA